MKETIFLTSVSNDESDDPKVLLSEEAGVDYEFNERNGTFHSRKYWIEKFNLCD